MNQAPEEVLIRPANLDDLDILIGLSDQLEEAASGGPYTPRNPEVRLPIIQEALQSENTKVLIVELGGAAVGYTSLVVFPNLKGRKEGKVSEIVIDQSLRRRGIGTQLFNAARDHFRNEGVEIFEVTTREDNHAAQRFYEKQGLVVDDVTFSGSP